MTWVEVFAALVMSHLVGDYLVQSDWQAVHKHGGMSLGNPVARRALLTHVLTYTLTFVPAVLIYTDGLEPAWVIPLIAIPHYIQDDGRLIALYLERVKGLRAATNLGVAAVVDQTFHLLALLGLALLLTA